MSNILEGLNERQIEAVTATEGYVRIIAGAGSGKTKALTNRYAYLVKAAGIHPGSILCVTFTNKAAGEMKKRVRALIGDGYDNSLITTYHGFCVRVLREHIGRLFYPESFQILDVSDQKTILEEIYGEMELKLDHASFERILDLIDKKKANTDYVDSMISRGSDSFPEPSTLDEKIIQNYLRRQKKVFGLDFNDLINFVFVLFERFTDVKELWQQRLEYIQVDEFQDSSSRELKLINILSEQKRNLFVVGDPDQNIYEWRGAKVEILVDFDRSHPGTQTVIMDQNYRSTAHILKTANTLIDRNQNRIKKSLFTLGEQGEEVIHLHAKSDYDECRFIAEEIKRLKAGGLDYSSVAVLYRASFLSRSIEQQLMAADIPYEIVGATKFFKRMEIMDALAYLKLVQGDDDRAFTRVINTPRRSFGKMKLALLKQLAEDAGLPLYEALKLHIALPEFKRTGAEGFIAVIEGLREKKDGSNVSELLNVALTETGYERYIREVGSMERLENLGELKKIAVEQERGWGESYPLDEFLRQVALMSDTDTGEYADKVKLMTIHAAKGLEFPAVFVIGFTDGIFPSSRTIEERGQAGLEEERRLCFVALTRAMSRLYLTDSEGTGQTGSGSTYKKIPSRFLFEIGEENYRRIGEISKELREEAMRKPSVMPSAPKIKAVGDRVSHSVFGEGVIIGYDEKRGVYSIKFDKSGTVKPISRDYDFDAWNDIVSSLNAKREAARLAREQNERERGQREPIRGEKSADGDLSPEILTVEEPDGGSDADKAVGMPNIDMRGVDSQSDNIRSGYTQDNNIKIANTPSDSTPSADSPIINLPVKNNDLHTDVAPTELETAQKVADPTVTAEKTSKPPYIDEASAQPHIFPVAPELLRQKSEPTEQETIDLPLADNKAFEKADIGIKTNADDPPDEAVITDDEFDEPATKTIDESSDNLWLNPNVPKSGWYCVGITDLGAPVGICRMCGKQIIRYVHHMRHNDFPREIGAGCVCAGRMEGDEEKARRREADFKNREARRATFISRPRKKSKNGNEYIKYKDEIFTIIPDRFKKGQFKVVYKGSYSQSHPTAEEALSEIFDTIDG